MKELKRSNKRAINGRYIENLEFSRVLYEIAKLEGKKLANKIISEKLGYTPQNITKKFKVLKEWKYINEEETSHKKRRINMCWPKIIDDFVFILLKTKKFGLDFKFVSDETKETQIKKGTIEMFPAFHLENPEFLKKLKMNVFLTEFLRRCFISLSSNQNPPTILEFLEYLSTRHFLIQKGLVPDIRCEIAKGMLEASGGKLSKENIIAELSESFSFNIENMTQEELFGDKMEETEGYHYSIPVFNDSKYVKKNIVSCFNQFSDNRLNEDPQNIKKEFKEAYIVFYEILPKILIQLNANEDIEFTFPGLLTEDRDFAVKVLSVSREEKWNATKKYAKKAFKDCAKGTVRESILKMIEKHHNKN